MIQTHIYSTCQAATSQFEAGAQLMGKVMVNVAGAAREYAVEGIHFASAQLKYLADKVSVATKLADKLATIIVRSLYDDISKGKAYIRAGASKIGMVVNSCAEKVSTVVKVLVGKIGVKSEGIDKLIKAGSSMREYTFKILNAASKQLENSRYAYVAVAIVNIIFLEVTLKIFEVIDELLDKTPLRDGNLWPNDYPMTPSGPQIFKRVILLSAAIGTLMTFNMAFTSALKPNIGQQAYLVTSIAACIGHCALRLALGNSFFRI